MNGSNGRRRSRAQMLDELRGAERFLLVTHENPDGDALGSLAGMQLVLAALGKDAVAFMAADEFPLPYEYRFIQLDGLVTEPPDDLEERTIVFLDCGNIDRNPADVAQARGRAHPQRRPPPRQHALRDGQPRRARGVVHGRDDLGPDARPRRRADAADRGGALRRPGHRHRQVHVREHRAARAPDGGRADRGRRRRARDLPAPLRGRAAGQARAAGARADQRRALRRRAADADAPERARTTRRPAPTPPTPRAWSTTCARSRAPRWPRSCATCPATASGAARCRCARPTTASTCRAIARAQGGGGHRRAAGFSTTMDYPQLVEVLRASLAEQL